MFFKKFDEHFQFNLAFFTSILNLMHHRHSIFLDYNKLINSMTKEGKKVHVLNFLDKKLIEQKKIMAHF